MVHLQRVVQISDSLSGIFHCVFNKNNFSNIVNMSSKIMVQQKHSSPFQPNKFSSVWFVTQVFRFPLSKVVNGPKSYLGDILLYTSPLSIEERLVNLMSTTLS